MSDKAANDIKLTFVREAQPVQVQIQSGRPGTDGNDGADGSIWISNFGVPAPATGNENDIYLNLTNYDIYQKLSGVWTLIGNIKGSPGTDGVPAGGTTGQILAKVSDADFDVDWVNPGSGGGGASTFLDLNDTPADYSGQQGRVAAVNVAQTGLEFIDIVTDLSLDIETSATSGTGFTADNIGGGTDVPLINFFHDSARAQTDYITDVFIGPDNGNPLAARSGGNIAVGQGNLRSITPGSGWVGGTFLSRFDGDRNVVVGFDSGGALTGGSNQATGNILMGERVLTTATDVSYNFFAGFQTARLFNVANNSNDGQSNVGIGQYVLENVTTAMQKSTSPTSGAFGTVAIGASVMRNTTTLGQSNLGIGNNVMGDAVIVNHDNTGVGDGVFAEATFTNSLTDGFSTGVGASAGREAVNPNRVTLIGAESGRFGGGDFLTAVGDESAFSIRGSGNSSFGYQSGHVSDNVYNPSTVGTIYTGTNSSFFGYRSGYDTTTPDTDNVIVIGTNYQPVLVSDAIFIDSLDLRLENVPQDDTNTRILTIDASTAQVEWRDVTTIGGTNFWLSDGDTTISNDPEIILGSNELTFTGNGTGIVRFGAPETFTPPPPFPITTPAEPLAEFSIDTDIFEMRVEDDSGSGTINYDLIVAQNNTFFNDYYFHAFGDSSSSTGFQMRSEALNGSNSDYVGFLFGNGTSPALTIVDTRSTTAGLQYSTDYSAGFNARSLIDRGTADARYIQGAATDFWQTGASNTLTANQNTTRTNGSNSSVLTVNDTIIRILNSAAGGVSGNVSVNSGQVSLSATDSTDTNTFIVPISGIAATYTSTASFPINYSGDYTANMTANSLITQAHADSRLGGNALDSTVTGPGAGQDGYALVWNNGNSEYELVLLTSFDYLAGSGLTRTLTDTAEYTIDLGGTVSSPVLLDGVDGVNTFTINTDGGASFFINNSTVGMNNLGVTDTNYSEIAIAGTTNTSAFVRYIDNDNSDIYGFEASGNGGGLFWSTNQGHTLGNSISKFYFERNVGNIILSKDGSSSPVGNLLTVSGTNQPNTRTMYIGMDNTDVYFDTAADHDMSFRSNGTERFAVNSSGFILNINGSASSPAWRWASDSDSGFYYGGVPGDIRMSLASALTAQYNTTDITFYEDDGTTELARFERDTGTTYLFYQGTQALRTASGGSVIIDNSLQITNTSITQTANAARLNFSTRVTTGSRAYQFHNVNALNASGSEQAFFVLDDNGGNGIDLNQTGTATFKGIKMEIDDTGSTTSGNADAYDVNYRTGSRTGQQNFFKYKTDGAVVLRADTDGVIHGITHTKSITIESPSSSEVIGFMITDQPITVVGVKAYVEGTTPSVDINFEHGTNPTSLVNVFTSDQTVNSTTSIQTFNSGFNDATIPVDSAVKFTTSATSGTVDAISVTLIYTID